MPRDRLTNKRKKSLLYISKTSLLFWCPLGHTLPYHMFLSSCENTKHCQNATLYMYSLHAQLLCTEYMLYWLTCREHTLYRNMCTGHILYWLKRTKHILYKLVYETCCMVYPLINTLYLLFYLKGTNIYCTNRYAQNTVSWLKYIKYKHLVLICRKTLRCNV